jgi:phospholipid/cholesterol/gamma-HCH transport system permease protein
MIEPLTLEPESSRLYLHGDWTLQHYRQLLKQTVPLAQPINLLDGSGLTALDTAGAAQLVRVLGAEQLSRLADSAIGLAEERRALLLAVAAAMSNREGVLNTRAEYRFGDAMGRLGRRVSEQWLQLLLFLSFTGQTLSTFIAVLPRPWRWRVTALVAQIHQTGLNAVPIVALLNFLVGAVVAFLGATVLRDFGAAVYTVDLVAYSFMRELGPLLAAILLAGRTASAFTAQIGSMKVNEELDALQVQGLSPIELLVLPRLIALLITLPLLSFVAILAGMTGGAAVSVLALDISLTRYLAIVQEVPVQHMVLGLSKTPVFALFIALIGCIEGFKVGDSAQSVGEHTTSAVVQSIAAVIVLDAIAALFFMGMGW